MIVKIENNVIINTTTNETILTKNTVVYPSFKNLGGALELIKNYAT